MYIPNIATPVETSPVYNYLRGETKTQTHFLRSAATNLGDFGELPWSLKEMYHKLIHILIGEGIDHNHPDFPATEKQAEILLRKYSNYGSDLKQFEKSIKLAVNLTSVQINRKRQNQKTKAREHGFTNRHVDQFYKLKGRGLLNLAPKELVDYMKLVEHG
jgi:hypothetical protein